MASSSEGSESPETHPVYIDRRRKSTVKTLAAKCELSMKEVTERFAEHGETLELYDLPVDASDEELIEHVESVLAEQ